jgi:hypothetical protein
MNRALALLLVLAGGCSANASLIEIGGPVVPTDDVACTFAPTGADLLPPGVLDVAGAAPALPSYRQVLRVTNNLPDPGSITAGSPPASKAWTANVARVRVNPAEYLDRFAPNPAVLTDAAGRIVRGENRNPLSSSPVQPAGGSRTQLVDLVSGPLGEQLGQNVAPGEIRRVVLGITLLGTTSDGASLDTTEWFFPLDLCKGCLAAPTCAAGQVLVPTNCFSGFQDTAPACVAAPL